MKARNLDVQRNGKNQHRERKKDRERDTQAKEMGRNEVAAVGHFLEYMQPCTRHVLAILFLARKRTRSARPATRGSSTCPLPGRGVDLDEGSSQSQRWCGTLAHGRAAGWSGPGSLVSPPIGESASKRRAVKMAALPGKDLPQTFCDPMSASDFVRPASLKNLSPVRPHIRFGQPIVDHLASGCTRLCEMELSKHSGETHRSARGVLSSARGSR